VYEDVCMKLSLTILRTYWSVRSIEYWWCNVWRRYINYSYMYFSSIILQLVLVRLV